MYTITTIGAGLRQISLSEADSLKYRFYKMLDKKKIKLRREGSRLTAYVEGEIAIYRLPRMSQLHRAVMTANGLALYRGLPGADVDRIMDNLADCIEIV